MARKTNPADPAQASVFDRPLSRYAGARSGDPETSKAAAASVQNMRASHRAVLAMFRAYGDMTDETLAVYLDEAARNTGLKRMSPSGVRSRRSELSQPNMYRLDVIAMGMYAEPRTSVGAFRDLSEEDQARARQQLRAEGFKSELWDTGKREALASGRLAIVWGIAR